MSASSASAHGLQYRSEDLTIMSRYHWQLVLTHVFDDGIRVNMLNLGNEDELWNCWMH